MAGKGKKSAWSQQPPSSSAFPSRTYGSGPNFQSGYQNPQGSNTAVAELKLQLENEKKSAANLQGELGKARDDVVKLKGLLHKKEADHITELKTLKDDNHRLSGQLTKERNAVWAFNTELTTQKDAARKLNTQLTLEQLQLGKERADMKSMRGELHNKGAEVLRLNGLLIKETKVEWALKAEQTELKKLIDVVNRLSGQLKEDRDEAQALRTELKTEKDAVQVLRTELKTEKYTVHRLSGQLTEERNAVRAFKTELTTQKDAVQRLNTQLTLEQQQLEKERADIKSMRGELQTKGAEVLLSKGLLIKETEVGWALKAEQRELRKLIDVVNRLSGQLKEERDAAQALRTELKTEKDAVQALRTELKTEKDAVHRLKTELTLEHRRAAVSLQKKDQELISMRKQLGEAESNLKSSVESWKELQRSYDELNRKNEELIRSKTMADIYEYYRRWSEDQSSRSLGMKKYDSWQLGMAVNRASKESTGKTRCGAVYNSELDHKEVGIEILNNKSYQRQQDFNQKVDILLNIRHPNLVSYIGEYEKKYALICEHLPDGTLQDWLVNKRQTSWEERIRISASICSTLLFLHNMKPSPVIHVDLEAQNISFDADNVCKLSVFGMSYSTQHTTITTNNNNNIVPSIQSDILAFGIVLLQIVTGQAEKDLVRKEVLKMGDLNQFQEKDIGWQREVLKNKKIVDDKLENWPTEDAVKMLVLGLRCSHPEENERPDLATEVWTQISSMKRGASESQGRPGGLFGL